MTMPMDCLRNVSQRVNNLLFQLSLVAIIAACLISSSCNRERDVKSTLADVETYIDEHPDSALRVINSIDTNAVRGRSVKAKYALLKSIALDKNYIDTTDTRIIAPAVEYYKHHGSKDDRLKSYYYLGRIQYNGGDYQKAIVTFTTALPVAEMLNDANSGLLYGAISDTYGMSYNRIESLQYAKKARQIFENIGDSLRVKLSEYMEADANMNLRRWKSADSLYSILISDGKLPATIKSRAYGNYGLLKLYSIPRDPHKAEEYFANSLRLSGGSLEDANHWGAYAYSLAAVGRKAASDSVFSALKLMGESGNDSYSYWMCNRSCLDSNYEKILLLIEGTLASRDSISEVMLSQSTAKAQRDYYAIQASNAQKAITIQGLVYIVAISSMLMILAVIYCLSYKRREKIEEERDRMIAIAETIKRQMAESDRQSSARYSSLKSEYVLLFKERYRDISELVEQYLAEKKYRHFSEGRKVMYEKVEKLLKEIGGDWESYEKMEMVINHKMDNLMLHFRNDFPNLKDGDYQFVICVIMGFDATTLSVIFKKPSLGAVYARKSRLKKMVSMSVSQYKDDYLLLLN
jgi:tetratricopeptide (TPR) repeat protein